MDNSNKILQHKIDEVSELLQREKMKAATSLLKDLIQKRPKDPKVLLLLGVAAFKQKDYELAKNYLFQALQLDNQLSEAHYTLASLYLACEQYDSAIEEYLKMSAQDTSYAAKFQLGLAFEHNWRFLEAKTIYEGLLKEYPEDISLYLHLANVQLQLLNIKEAIALCERGLTFSPKSIELLNQLGVALAKDQQTTRALKCFHKVLAMRSDNVQALFNLSQQHQFKDEHFPETKAIQEALNTNTLNEHNRALCHYALGRIYDVSNYHERAFFHYEKANTLCAKEIHYDENEVIDKISRIQSIFSANVIAQKSLLTQPAPLFVVGLSGAGKALLAKALSKHPHIAILPSQRMLDNELNKIIQTPSLLTKATTDSLKQLAQNYLNLVNKLAPNASVVCDLAPDNAFAIGLIAILFPNATLLHCTRHPMDLCLSAYFHYHGNENAYVHHLSSLGKYYQHHAKLMSYWQSIGILNRMEVKYEALVQNPNQILSQLFEQLKLSPASLTHLPRFYSYEIDRWKKYQHFLGPLIEVLYNSE